MLDVNKLWTEKTQKLGSRVRAIARGDADCYQEGLLGTRKGLLKDQNATDSYLLQNAKFAMTNYKSKGKSIDNGSRRPVTKKLRSGAIKTYQKDMIPVSLSRSGMELPDYSHPPDILALDRVCAERFYGSLNEEEAELVETCIRMLGCRSYNFKVMQNRVRGTVYQKFVRAFGTDAEIACQ